MIEIRKTALATPADSAAAYDAFYVGHSFPLRDSFYQWILSLMRPARGQRLLDLGCGVCRLTALAARSGVCAVGVDLSRRALLQGAARGSLAVQGDCERLPFADASFDFVANIGSLEHFLDPIAGLQEMRRVLRPTGLMCVLVPNVYGLFGNILHVWRHGEVFDDGQPLQRYGTRRTWQAMIERAGVRVERIIAYERELPHTVADAGWMLVRPAKLVRACLAFLVPVNVANCLVFLGRAA